MNEKKSLSGLDKTIDDIVSAFRNNEEEVQKLNKKKDDLHLEVENQKKLIEKLELEKSELDAEIARMSLENLVYHKERAKLCNDIALEKLGIQKIKESISQAKAEELKNLEDFEKAVDEITMKFRSGPLNYDRKILLEKIEKEKEKREILVKKMEELKNCYEGFCKERGLRMRKDEKEELIDCVLPGSRLSCLIEMMKTLDEVTCGIKKLTKDVKQHEENLEDPEEKPEITNETDGKNNCKR